MTLRAQSARWFEVLVPRATLARAAEALGATGLVEFDPDRREGEPLDLSGLRGRLGEFHRLASLYRPLWPQPVYPERSRDVLLEATLDSALQRLQRWAEQAGPVTRRLGRLRGLHHDLTQLRDCLDAFSDAADLDLGALVSPQQSLDSALLILPPDADLPAPTRPLVYRRAITPGGLYLLLLGEAEAVAEAVREWTTRKGRSLALPRWLEGGPATARAETERRLAELESRIARQQSILEKLNRRHRVAESLGEIQRLEWMVEHLAGLPVTRGLAWLTGWSADPTGGAALTEALERADIPGVMRFPAPPRDKVPPTLLRNPAWARPFELFVGLLGTPGRGDTDPSGLVAVIAPLLFGYMFGDVGQGAVLLLAGLLLRRRLPVAGLLVSGGAMAMVFGVLFGTVFSREDLIPALWTHPIEHPLEVLVPPLVLGAALIALGQIVQGLSAWWSGALRSWVRIDLGLLILYAGAALGVLSRWALLVAAVGGAWYLAGHALESRHGRLMALAGGVGELAEEGLRLLVNTLSFVRVGAFALAHAGLSLAVVSLADAAGPVAGLLVMVLGNLGIILLEGLVVSVQTTRLILFEFFIRFVRAEGRPFHPSRPPASSAPA